MDPKVPFAEILDAEPAADVQSPRDQELLKSLLAITIETKLLLEDLVHNQLDSSAEALLAKGNSRLDAIVANTQNTNIKLKNVQIRLTKLQYDLSRVHDQLKFLNLEIEHLKDGQELSNLGLKRSMDS